MTKAERIREWIANHPQPDQDLCPELIQYWKKRNGVYEEWHSKTGERIEVTTERYRPGYNAMSVRSWYYGAYFKADGDMLEIARVEMPGNRGRAGEPKTWRWGISSDRFFIFKGDPAAYDKCGNPLAWGQKTYYNEWLRSYIADMQRDIYDMTTLDVLEKYVTENYGANIEKSFYVWHFAEFYKMNWLPRKRSKAAQNVLSYNLPEMQRERGTVQFQIVDDNYAVFRCWASWAAREEFRIFISKDGKVSIAKSDGGNWRLTPSLSYIPGTSETNFSPEELQGWQPLKWLVPCMQFEHTESYYRGHANADLVIKQIIRMLRHPIIESLSKSGYPTIAKVVSYNNEIPKNLKYYFGVKERKGNLYKVLGVNKWLLKAVEEHGADNQYSWRKSESLRAVKSLKDLYGRNDISDLSKETIAAMFPGMLAFEISNSDWKWCIFGDRGWRYRGAEVELTDDQRKKMLKVVRFCSKHPMVAQSFIDTANMKRQLGDAAPDIDIFSFENENDLARMHNGLVELREQQRRVEEARYNECRKAELEEQRKMFDKLQEKRVEKYEYEDNEFCIRVPHKLEEITVEGSALHHCVGSYLGRHASGNTNIIFLRRKAAQEMPFYTIEICNGRLIQIHGAHNRWLGNNPEAIPFVYEWLQQLGDVRFDVDMLLNKASGYGKSQDQLDTSYLYRKESVA